MQSKLYSFSFIVLLFIALSSCKKWLPENRIEGSWRLTEVEKRRAFGNENINSGYESGVFRFNENGTASYTGATDTMQGNWQITWTCVRGCPMRRPGLTYSPRLEIVGATQIWTNELCPECTATFFGEETVDGCIDVTASADFDSQCRFSYRICEMEGELRGSVTWKEPGVSAVTWQITGRR